MACRRAAIVINVFLAATELVYTTPGTGRTVIVVYLLPRASAWTRAIPRRQGGGTPGLTETDHGGPTEQRGDQKLSHSSSPYAQLPVNLPTRSTLRNRCPGEAQVTPDTALRLARVLGMSADFWLGLQQDWDLWHAMHGVQAAEIEQLEPLKEYRSKLA